MFRYLLLVLLTLPFIKSETFAASDYDHTYKDFNKVLSEHVVVKDDGSTLFNYAQLKRKPIDFIRYLKNTSKVKDSEFNSFTKEQQIAFLVNAYNAFTIQLVMDNYPTTSIKKIKGLLPSPWKVNFIRLLGQTVNLDHIENEWLRKKFSDPRIHFATCSSTLSSPFIRNEAYVPEQLESQLNNQTQLFLNFKNQNQIDAKNKKITLSKIFSWFKEDFNKNELTVFKFIAQHISSDEAIQKSLVQDSWSLDYSDYNWNLNDKKP